MKKIPQILFTLAICLFGTNSNSQVQNALGMDGIDDFVQTTFSGIQGSSARTVEAWIKTTANCDPGSGGVQQVISDWGSNTTGGRFTFNVLWGNAIRIEVNGNGLSGTIPVNDGNWHHVACVWDPASPMPAQLYVDGVLDVAGTISVAVNTGNAVNMRIGLRVDGARYFDGTIDELRVWNTAKSLVDLMANMNNELCTLSNDLVAYYNFNHGVPNGNNAGITNLEDMSGNGNDGILNTFALGGATSNWVDGVSLSSGITSSLNTETGCNSFTWPANGQTYTNSGTYSTILTGAGGCDSIATINLTVYPTNNLTTNATSCDSYTWSVNGQTYTSSTVYDTLITTAQGCTYMHTLNVTINDSYENTDQISACSPFIWGVNGASYSTSGIYSETYSTAGGCDSVLNLDLTILSPATADILQNGDGSLSTSWQADIQWVDCDNNYSPIQGETGMSFIPTANGTYAMIASDTGLCNDTSSCIVVDYIGLNQLAQNGVHVYPNPTQDEIKVSFGDYVVTSVAVLSMDGRLISKFDVNNQKEIQVNLNGEAGVYLLRVIMENGESYSEFVVKR